MSYCDAERIRKTYSPKREINPIEEERLALKNGKTREFGIIEHTIFSTKHISQPVRAEINTHRSAQKMCVFQIK